MNRTPLCLTLGAFVTFSAVTSADAFLGDLLKRDEKKLLNAEELTTQEGSAGPALAKAQQYEQSGKSKQARDAYKSVTRNFPRTDAAAEAQFGYAKMLEATGNDKDAFEEYENLVANYRNTSNFNEAIQRQFSIAETMMKTERKGFLGLGASVQPSKLVEMFESIAEAAPYTEFAPRSLLNIGYVHTKQSAVPEAIGSFQSVVDTYGGTNFASEAQYQIFKLRGVTAENSNSPVEDRAQVEAGLDFMSQNPDDNRTQEIKSNLDQIEERSMEKLFTTGQFYEKSGKPDSARVYYREVARNPNSSWAPKAQQRLSALDSAPDSVEKKAGLFGPKPAKKEKIEMRTSDDTVVPLPLEEVPAESE